LPWVSPLLDASLLGHWEAVILAEAQAQTERAAELIGFGR
jgi:hypothetical protein